MKRVSGDRGVSTEYLGFDVVRKQDRRRFKARRQQDVEWGKSDTTTSGPRASSAGERVAPGL